MKAVERYRAELNELKAPAALKEKLLGIPAQYGASATTSDATQAAEHTPSSGAESKQQPKGKAIRFTLPTHWKRQLVAAAACFMVGAFATDALGWQVLPRMGSSGADQAEAAYESNQTDAGPMANAAPADANTGFSNAGASFTDDALADTIVTEGEAGDADAASIPQGATTRAVSEAITRKIIYTTDLTLETKAYDETLAALSLAVTEADGYLEYSEASGNAKQTDERNAYFIYRIPAEAYTAFLAGVGETGNITYQTESADDVTDNYLDLEARITTLTQQRDRLWALQTEAATLTDLLEIEATLTDVLYQIESYQSKLNYLADQVSYATVSVNLHEVIEYTVQEPSVWQTITRTFMGSITGFLFTMGSLLLTILSLWVWIALAFACVLVYHGIKRKNANKHQ